jgi:hypothetical protein
MTNKYLRDKGGFIYDWNPILAKNPNCVEVTEQEAFPEKFVPEKQKARKSKMSLATDEVPEPPVVTPTVLAEEAAKGFPK